MTPVMPDAGTVSAALAALTLTAGMTSDLSLVTRRVTPAESRYFAILFYEFKVMNNYTFIVVIYEAETRCHRT